MDNLINKLNSDLAMEVMNRENARRMYQGERQIEKIAYYTGRIEYISALMDYIKSNK